jgi:hypothetical protein
MYGRPEPLVDPGVQLEVEPWESDDADYESLTEQLTDRGDGTVLAASVDVALASDEASLFVDGISYLRRDDLVRLLRAVADRIEADPDAGINWQ